jgi:hypothetical protein
VALDIHSPDRRHRSSFPRRYASVVGGAGYALVGWAATAHAWPVNPPTGLAA